MEIDNKYNINMFITIKRSTLSLIIVYKYYENIQITTQIKYGSNCYLNYNIKKTEQLTSFMFYNYHTYKNAGNFGTF